MVSLVKRYTPPTCCLEIVGKISPLSIYLQKPTVKELYFQLNFDDPRDSADKKITVRGDRTLLDSLANAVREYIQDFLTQPINLRKLPPKTSQPYLYSQGLVNHKLHLGNTSPESSASSIILSAVQLFDLANALEEYSQEIANLPQFYRSQSRKAIPIFITITGTILAVGITFGLKLLEPSPKTSELNKKVTNTEFPITSEAQPITKVVPPQPSKDQPIKQVVIPPSLKEREKLPPPIPVTPPKPPQLSQSNQKNTNNQPTKVEPSSGALLIIPQNQPQTKNTTQPEIVINSQSPEVPTFPNNLSRDNSKDSLSPSQTDFNPTLSSNSDSFSEQITENEKPQDELPRLANDNIEQTDSLFDYMPQIAEVRNYFQNQWQPPEDLKQTLQYRLVINKNGTLQTVIPIGYNSEIYLPQVKFPSNSQSFVSPLSDNKQVIRLLLQPDGKVVTFLDN